MLAEKSAHAPFQHGAGALLTFEVRGGLAAKRTGHLQAQLAGRPLHRWVRGHSTTYLHCIRIEKAVSDRPDFPAYEKLVEFVAADSYLARAIGKTALCKLHRQVRIGKAEAKEVRRNWPSGTSSRNIFYPTLIVPGSNLAAFNIEHKDELCTKRCKPCIKVSAANRRSRESFGVNRKNEVWQTR